MMMMATSESGARTKGRELVIALSSSGAVADRVGGKAAPLARASAAGHRVPPAVVITADAFGGGLDPIRRELDEVIAALGEGPFAVRSSAIAEDGSARSFAGQLETVLDVARADVPAAIERCWASANALRALRYAGGGVGPVAVIVQRMVPADVAGVAFSADPRTGARGVVVLEAVRGLGDALVSGRADPERWSIDATSARRTNAGDVLDETRARRVAKLARDCESLFGAPQDVEWAFHGDELFLLQSRPITALPAAPVPIAIDVPKGDWDRDDHHGVLSPLGWAWFQAYPKGMAAAFKHVGMPLERIDVARIGGHLYMQMVMGGGGDRVPPRWVLWLVSRVIPSLRRANRKIAELLDTEGFLKPLEDWERAWRPAMRRDIAALDVEDPRSLTDEALLKKIDEALALTARGLDHHAWLGGPGIMSLGKLAIFAEDHLGWSGERIFSLVTGSSAATTAMQRQLEEIVDAHASELGTLGDAPISSWATLRTHCPSMAAALSDWLASNRLRMLHYDPKHASLGERPELVLSVVDAIVTSRRANTSHAVHAEPVEQEALRDASERLSPEQLTELKRLIALAKRTYGLRDENGVETVSRPAGLLRHFVLELGRRIEPRIGAREHAVYLYPEEHAAALRGELADIGARIERRRGEESWALQNRGPRRYGQPRGAMPPFDAFPDGLARMMRIMGWMEKMESTPDDSGDEGPLRGVGVGARVVTARARVIDRPEQLAQLRHGEIVVCRITSPEWSIGLARMGAIVTNEGGMLSHPAIIAREYGIPAVVGAASATRRIDTGDTLRVDPATGTVTIVRKASAPRAVDADA